MKFRDLLPFSCRSSSLGTLGRGKKELNALYEVKDVIGRGGFGVVYAAKRKSDGLEVAVKEVSKDSETLTNNNVPLEVALMQQVNDVPGQSSAFSETRNRKSYEAWRGRKISISHQSLNLGKYILVLVFFKLNDNFS